MSKALTKNPTLEELIDQQIELGHKNPHEFPDLLRTALGEDLLAVAQPYLESFIVEMGRHRLSQRRRISVARITKTSLNSPDIMIQSLWVPAGPGNEITYKRLSDMTADDFDARADYLERMSLGIHRHAQWCRAVANNIRDHSVNTAGQLGTLPPLPDYEDLPDLPQLTP